MSVPGALIKKGRKQAAGVLCKVVPFVLEKRLVLWTEAPTPQLSQAVH